MAININLEKYTDIELLELNDRIKRIIYSRREAEEMAIMAGIKLGDTVGFHDKKGKMIFGTVMEKFEAAVGVHTHNSRGKQVDYEVSALAIKLINPGFADAIPLEFRKGPHQSGKLWQ